MSDRPQPGFPFGFGGFDLNEVMRMLQSEGPINLEIARQIASWAATEGKHEPAIDAADVALLGELTRTAHMHVVEATGLGSELQTTPRTINRSTWAEETLEGLRPVLTTLAERLGKGLDEPDEPQDDAPAPGSVQPDLSSLMTAMAPMFLGLQAGFMIGHLASRVLGNYEMPLPLSQPASVTVVGSNVLDFESAWELPREELRFYVALHEVLHAAMRSVPWVQTRMMTLADEYVSAFDIDPSRIEERLAGVDPSDPSSLQSALGDPAEFLDAIRPPAQREVLDRLKAMVALLEGYADHVLGRIGSRLISEFSRIREASHRHRVERGEAARFLEALLGFEVGRTDYEHAAAFCDGVVERAGDDGLRRLWEEERMLPTPAELDAPGLWLERIDLPE